VPETGQGWRILDGVPTAWFDALSLREGARLAVRVLEQVPEAAVDVRTTGVRVRLDPGADPAAVSAAASELGLAADPGVPQRLGVLVDAGDPAAVRPFWQRALAYVASGDGALVDPLRRDPPMRILRSAEHRPLRNRIHLDVVRPAEGVEHADLGEAYGPFGVCHADPDGNEVDLVPGSPLGESAGTADWQVVFSAMACYRVGSPVQQRDLAATAAALADDAGFPLLVDLRPGLVVLDTGKDRWHPDAHGLDLAFADLARDLQAAARDLGALADPGLPRFVQVFLDAADVEALRTFWATVLGYDRDRRGEATDVHDPRWLNPVLLFQPIDTSDTARRRQRNRIHLELAVPADVARSRVDTAVAAGGRLLEASGDRWLVADPEGNELVVVGEASTVA